jgi:uncharacterized protein involved in exopolysaccharide biosynthesis
MRKYRRRQAIKKSYRHTILTVMLALCLGFIFAVILASLVTVAVDVMF